MTQSLCKRLLARYKSIGLKPPDWAHPLPPSIPFVGNHYGRWGGILVYASAENLSNYELTSVNYPAYLKDHRALNRHRAAFEVNPKGVFFRHVHMMPFDDGSLLVATLFYLYRQHGRIPKRPKTLLEAISAANLCKFSIAGLRNTDHATSRDKVSVSVPYFRADLSTLRPNTVFLPNTIFKKNPNVQQALSEIVPEATVILIPQFNPTVVNCHLNENAQDAKYLQRNLRGTPVQQWVDQMKRYGEGRPYWYLVELDRILETL